MQIPNSHRSRNSGLTRIELLTIMAILAIIAALVFPAISAFLVKRWLTTQLSNGKQIYFAMRTFAAEADHAGQPPIYKTKGDPKTIVTSSNDAFEMLMGRYMTSKEVFFNPHSAFCKAQPATPENANKVLPGECDWVYVRGLNNATDGNWPFLANAFAPGTTTYVKDAKQKGGVWRGVDAIVIWAGGSAAVVETREKEGNFYVARTDKPAANAFEKDGDYLRGENVKVLEPK